MEYFSDSHRYHGRLPGLHQVQFGQQGTVRQDCISWNGEYNSCFLRKTRWHDSIIELLKKKNKKKKIFFLIKEKTFLVKTVCCTYTIVNVLPEQNDEPSLAGCQVFFVQFRLTGHGAASEFVDLFGFAEETRATDGPVMTTAVLDAPGNHFFTAGVWKKMS